MQEHLKGAFIYGVGLIAEQLVVEIANNSAGKTYRLWIDTPIVCKSRELYVDKGLEADEIALLTVNQLKYLAISKATLTENEDLELVFEDGMGLTILGSNPNINCYEPWRIHQIEPENKVLLIVCNK
jgi:hypothetical protein